MNPDFEYQGRRFKLNKLDPFKQLHIVRRITPILSELIPVMKKAGLNVTKLNDIDALSEKEKLDMIAEFLSPVLMGMSKLSDEDTEHVLYGLLESVEMQQPQGNWAKIAVNKMLMFHDLELALLVNAAGRAFAFNLTRFFSALPQ